MIKLKKDNLTMEVGTNVQASAFIRNGWEVVKNESKDARNEEKKYSKSDISRMSAADLRTLASTLGIEESTGAKLKEEIIAKLGL